MELPMMPSGRLRAASIVLKQGPSWWDIYGKRVIGLCAGSVLALLVIGSFRRTFLPQPSASAPRAPDPDVRALRCGARCIGDALYELRRDAEGIGVVKSRAIWHVPLLIAAGITALAGIGASVAVIRGAVPGPWAPALPWAFGAFTLARIIHARRVGQRELELIVLASALLIAHAFLVVAAGAVVLSLLGLIGTETRERNDEPVEPVESAPASYTEEERDEWGP